MAITITWDHVIDYNQLPITIISCLVAIGSCSNDIDGDFRMISSSSYWVGSDICQKRTFIFVTHGRFMIISDILNCCNLLYKEIAEYFDQFLISWTTWDNEFSFVSDKILCDFEQMFMTIYTLCSIILLSLIYWVTFQRHNTLPCIITDGWLAKLFAADIQLSRDLPLLYVCPLYNMDHLAEGYYFSLQ